jgi:hypothetical protein
MRTTLVGVAATLAVAIAPASALAVSTKVDCVHLQSALTAANEGDVITLEGLCASGFPFKLPAKAITLTGTAGSGFSGGNTVQLEVDAASATIENLVFENVKSAGLAGGGMFMSPAAKAVTLTLAGDTFSNETVAGEGGGADLNDSEADVSISNSSFIGDSAASNGGGLAIAVASAALSGDTFSGDSAGSNGSGGGLSATIENGSLTGSQFSGNSATNRGGGAAIATSEAGGLALTLTGDTFAHNSVADPGGTSESFFGYAGGGLSFEDFGIEPTTVVQSANTFDANAISFKGSAKTHSETAVGGGEAVEGAELHSTADRFTDNTLQSPQNTVNKSKTPEPQWGWGAGLSVIGCGDPGAQPPAKPNIVSTLADAVVAANTLASGPSANGAGIYVGSICSPTYSTLNLYDSTVSGNAISGAAGPAAGIDGGPHDVLSLANTIVASDSGGAELAGFAGLANASATHSDLCAGAAPFAGAGNICADPKLVGGADVHETAASPTLGAGANALVPAGLATDAYGGPRILGPLGCGSNPAAIVDIGAAELSYPAPPCVALLPLLKPSLSSLSETAKTWREGKLLAHLSATPSRHTKKKPPIGTTFSFKLDRAATVTFKFTTSARGRRLGKRCVAQTPKNKHHHACRRSLTAGALSFAAHAGTNKVSFDGLISKHKHLAAGKGYALLVTATASGLHSSTSTLRFTISR